jgi:hypothetical protein
MERPTNEYLVFEEHEPAQGKKTKTVHVKSVRGAYLGMIIWYGAWRCYTFQPAPVTVFNHGCLKTINEYIAQLMDERR